MLNPLGVSTGDGRRFAPGKITWRQLPLAQKWQRADNMGHDDSVIVGSFEQANTGTVAEAVKAGWISREAVNSDLFPDDLQAVWGGGELFDDVSPQTLPRLAEDVAEAKLLLSKQVIGPSVDLAAVSAVLVEKGSDTPLTEEDFEQLWIAAEESGEELELEVLITEGQIAAATLVAIPAFEQCRPFELLETEPAAMVAAVRSSGWGSLPLAGRDVTWDAAAADKRVSQRCGLDGQEPDWSCYASAHLYMDDGADPESKGAYGFPIVDVVGGDTAIVPAAVFTVAAVLQGGRGGTDIPQADQDAMKGVVEKLYQRMADEFDDSDIVAPWVAEQQTAAAARVQALAVQETPGGTLAPAEWFVDPQLEQVTPLTLTEDGRVFGHLATHDVCHAGFRDMCWTAPSGDGPGGYGTFHRYVINTVEGPLDVGRLTIGHGQFRTACPCCRGKDDHACDRLSAAGAMAHHDRLKTVAWIRVGEDERNNAVWFSGVLDEDVNADDLRVLSRRKVSGDWRPIRGQLTLVELLGLSTEQPAFPLPRARIDGGRVQALVAAGTVRHVNDRGGAGSAATVLEQILTAVRSLQSHMDRQFPLVDRPPQVEDLSSQAAQAMLDIEAAVTACEIGGLVAGYEGGGGDVLRTT